jgi:hypothetical protein
MSQNGGGHTKLVFPSKKVSVYTYSMSKFWEKNLTGNRQKDLLCLSLVGNKETLSLT